MFIQNIDELNTVVTEIKSLSDQLDKAMEKLKNFDIKIDPDYIDPKPFITVRTELDVKHIPNATVINSRNNQ